MTQERRRFARVSMDGQVTVKCASASRDLALLDISLRGALCTRPDNWHPATGEQCRLTIAPGAGEITIDMEGTVVHVEANFVGFRCDHIDLDSISHLKRLVELNLGDEAELERELGELLSGQMQQS